MLGIDETNFLLTPTHEMTGCKNNVAVQHKWGTFVLRSSCSFPTRKELRCAV
jgi:hypothetical protein